MSSKSATHRHHRPRPAKDRRPARAPIGRDPSLLQRWALPLAVAAVASIIAVAALTGGLGSSSGAGGPGPDAAAGAPAVGSRAPDFSALDVVSGDTLRLSDLDDGRALLFFSEGASCQACLVQIADLERSKQLRKRGIELVSVTTDSPETLEAVAGDYGIETPLLSDSSREMSSAYGMLGRGGMGHPETDGHAFVLLDRGRVVWERAYEEMYVPPRDLVEALPGRD
jgi:peroxiredoxin